MGDNGNILDFSKNLFLVILYQCNSESKVTCDGVDNIRAPSIKMNEIYRLFHFISFDELFLTYHKQNANQ